MSNYPQPVEASLPEQTNRGTAYNLNIVRMLLRNIRGKRMNEAFGNNPTIVSEWVGREFGRTMSFEGAFVRDIDHTSLMTALYTIGSEFNEHVPFNYDKFKDGFMDMYNIRIKFIVGTPDYANVKKWFEFEPENNLDAETLQYLRDVSALISGVLKSNHIDNLNYMCRNNPNQAKFPYGFSIDSN